MRVLTAKQAVTPLAAGLCGIAVLTATFIVPPLYRDQDPWPRFAPLDFGCAGQSRTVRHRAGRVVGVGEYRPCLIDTGMSSGEPGLAITHDGTLIRSVTLKPAGIAVSYDNGRQWIRRPLPAGSRDGIPDGYIDPVTDRYFYSALGNSPVYSSDDKGLTWRAGSFDSTERYDWNKVFSGRPVRPRAGGYPTNVYYCNMTQPGGFLTGARCFKSTDGGRRFVTSGSDPYRRGDCTDYTQPQGSGAGRGLVDPRDGTIYLPVHYCGVLEIAVSRDEGGTWVRQTVEKQHGSGGTALLAALSSPAWRHQLIHGRKNIVPMEMAANQASDAIAMDGAGRMYMVWIDADYLPVLATSDNQAKTWSKPVRIGAPGLSQAVLPSLAVTADGRIGISYYGTTDRKVWTGYMSVGSAGGSAQPVFETAPVTGSKNPLMPEPCCWASGPQEYTAVRWAPDGSLWGAFIATTQNGDARGVMGRLVREAPQGNR